MKTNYLLVFVLVLAAWVCVPTTASAQAKTSTTKSSQAKEPTYDEMNSCIRGMTASYGKANNLRRKKTSVKGFVESKESGDLYLASEKDMKGFYNPDKGISSMLTAQNLAACNKATKGFDEYVSTVGAENQKAIDEQAKKAAEGSAAMVARQAAAAEAALTPEDKKRRADIDACAKKLWVQLEAHNKVSEDARKFLSWARAVEVYAVIESVGKEFNLVLDTKIGGHYTADNLKKCEALVGDKRVQAAYDTASGVDQAKAACVEKLKTLRTSNTSLKDEAEKSFGDKKAGVSKAWADVDKKLDATVKSMSESTYKGDGKECTALAANTEVRTAYDAAKKLIDDAAAAEKKRLEDAEKQKAATAAAAAEKQKVPDCVAGWKKRIDDARARASAAMQTGAVNDQDLVPYKTYLDRAITEQGQMAINVATLTLAQCQQPSNNFTNLDGAIAAMEKKVQAKKDQQAKEDAAREAKALEEEKKWLAEHPKDISGACDKACTIRHGGSGPKQQECARLCTVAKKGVEDAVNYAFDQTVFAGLDAALNQMGVSKALCEAANSKAGAALDAANEQIKKFQGKVTEGSKQKCLDAKGSAAKCEFVGVFIKAVTDAKSCSDQISGLKNSLSKTSKSLEDKTKLRQKTKDKGNKGTKEEENALKDAAKDVAKESTETCSSPKASDLIKAIMQPCLDAATGATYILTHPNDYK